jgi:hypothetical protein
VKRTVPAPDARPAPVGLLGIGSPRVPSIDYFPNETIAEWLARHGAEPGNGRGLAAWLHIEEELG